MKITISCLVISLLLISSIIAGAVQTSITVMVRSKDAKFLGSSMGGALVTIRNLDTGELLAKGVTSGTTGSTERIMSEPHRRNVPLSDKKSAKFTATIDLIEPTLVEIKVFGPLAQRQSANIVSLTQWLIPGRDIIQGDALLMELPGFVVDILSPPAHIKFSANQLPLKLDIQANVIMMCGCPISPEGMWDADKYEVKALIKRNGIHLKDLPLEYSGKTSQFSAPMEINEAGIYEITVYAFDPINGNSGVDKSTTVVE